MSNRQTPLADPQNEYSRRLANRVAARDSVEKQHRLMGRLRLLTFAVAVATGYGAIDRRLVSGWWLVPLAALFLWLGGRLQRLRTERARLGRAVAFYERALERLAGRWAGRGESGVRFHDEHHPYAHDLDIFGEASLFQLLCGARTPMGEETLASWLRTQAAPDIVLGRQEAVSELTPRLDLREDLAVVAEKARKGVKEENLAQWGERPAILKASPFRWVAAVFVPLGAVAELLILLYFPMKGEFPAAVVAWVGIYIVTVVVIAAVIYSRFKERTQRILSELEDAAQSVSLLSGVLQTLEGERFTSPRLAALRAELDSDGFPPSRRLAKLDKIIDLLDSRHHPLMRTLGPLTLWDLNLSYIVEGWRRTSGPAMRRWLNAVGEVEATSSLASYSYEHAGNVFPEFAIDSPCYDAESLIHPLLPRPDAVANDVHLGGDLRVLVVSGSNMSGKSTLLRAIGVNAILAQAGAPVCAKRLRLSPLAVGASIQLQDSLREGTSRFYAEIQRLRQVMDLTDGDKPVLFLIDEFLHGTNSHDRRIGAEAIVRRLVDRGAIGLITTHDLALAHIADSLGARGANVHFEDHLEDGRMRFDFHMRPGVVQKSNALELMRSVGLDV